MFAGVNVSRMPDHLMYMSFDGKSMRQPGKYLTIMNNSVAFNVKYSLFTFVILASGILLIFFFGYTGTILVT